MNEPDQAIVNDMSPSAGKQIIEGLREITKKLKSGEPIEVTTVRRPIESTGEKLSDVERAMRAIRESVYAMRANAVKAVMAAIDLEVSIRKERGRLRELLCCPPDCDPETWARRLGDWYWYAKHGDDERKKPPNDGHGREDRDE